MSNIGKLVKKELIFLTKSMKMQLIIITLFLTLFPMVSPSLAGVGSFIGPYLAIYGAMAYQERYKEEALIATLPVSRAEICLSKYMLGIIYTLTGVICSSIFIMIGSFIMPESAMRLSMVNNIVSISVGMAFVGSMYTAIILPIILKWGTDKSRYIMFLLYVGMFAGMGVIGAIWGEVLPTQNLLGSTGVIIGIAILGIILYIISILISVRIFNQKEFS